jgi:hypothetical protein
MTNSTEYFDAFALGGADPIVALGREFDRIRAAQDAAEARNDADESDALGLQLNAVEDEIAALVPTSVAGVRLQLELLCRFRDFEWDEMHDALADKMLAGLRSMEALS